MQGIDVSNHQGLINWPAVAKAGYGFAWCKLSEGSGYRDAFAARNLAGAQAAGMLAGGYHFARPASSTPEVQADLAASMAKGVSLPLVLDLEQDPASATWSVAQRLDWAGRFLARADALTGHRAALYTGAWFLGHQLGGGGPLLVGRLLWLASYGTTSLAGPWQVWQYTSSATVPGVAGACDVSRTSLTRAQLAAYAHDKPLPTTHPETTMYLLKSPTDPKVYKSDGFVKHWIGPSEYQDWTKVTGRGAVVVAQATLDGIPDAALTRT